MAASLVEVVTPTSRDERRDGVEKRVEYARFGIRWYWLVDPALGTFEILALDADGLYKVVTTATKGRIAKVPGCKGLRIDVDKLWSRLARLAPDAPPARKASAQQRAPAAKPQRRRSRT